MGISGFYDNYSVLHENNLSHNNVHTSFAKYISVY